MFFVLFFCCFVFLCIFVSCKELLEELNQFIANVDNGKMGCVRRVLRVKNMFSKCFIDKKNNDSILRSYQMQLDKYSYCDIKLNVIIEVNQKQIIGEVQFLLSWMLQVCITMSY